MRACRKTLLAGPPPIGKQVLEWGARCPGVRATHAPTGTSHLSHPSPAAAPHLTVQPDPLQALRHATAAQHAQLDSGLAIARDNATLADYARHAHALAAWLQALRPQLEALQAEAPGFSLAPASRLNFLRDDLADMGPRAGFAWPAPSPATAQCVQQALSRHLAHAHAVRWGIAYVVEGSQLGGQVLYRRLSPQLAPHALRYLQGDGAATGARWKSFIALLRRHLASAQAVEAACQGAWAAFEGLQNHLMAAEGTPV